MSRRFHQNSAITWTRGEGGDKGGKRRAVAKLAKVWHRDSVHREEEREEREERILQPSANENYMRNPFPPWKPGFYRLVRNTGCLDKSNLSCSICICIRRQRALRRLLRVGTHRRSRVPFQIRVFANTPRTHAHTPSLSLLLIPPRLSPYLFISASALMSSHPRREKSPSSLLLLLLVRTNFPSVPLNFVPRLSRLAIEVFCDSRLFEEITPCLPSFPPCDVRIVKGDRIVVRCAVFESRNESMFFGGGGFVRCSWQTICDI